ncbi:MAG: isoprenylcysteine carboxylmethyltransferase family protein [Acidobacteriia bacterium]|nr:isoprenylcysteine carboxylmethyltransferase family protein [Terriglobia bacterium]
MVRRLLSLAGFAVTLAIWWWVKARPLSRELSLAVVIGGPLAFLPVVWAGRAMVDARPTPERCAWTATLVHFVGILVLGSGIIEGIKVAYAAPGWRIPIPAEVGQALTLITGLGAVLTVVNLAVRGLGAPFAVALSRRLATDWMYAWTRNPMVLGTFACLLSVGVWLRSAWFLGWVLCLLTPVWLAFLKVYEERELEVRFGPPYLAYRSKTPFLWPRRPKP